MKPSLLASLAFALATPALAEQWPEKWKGTCTVSQACIEGKCGLIPGSSFLTVRLGWDRKNQRPTVNGQPAMRFKNWIEAEAFLKSGALPDDVTLILTEYPPDEIYDAFGFYIRGRWWTPEKSGLLPNYIVATCGVGG